MSNRLTFSLTSLIFLIALGLVFVPMSVMADDGADADHGVDGHAGADAATTAEDTYPEHRHPTVRIELIDADVSTDATGVQNYNGNNILEDVPFRLKVTFSHPVTGFAANEITILNADANGEAVATVNQNANLIADASTFTAVTPTGGTPSTTEYTIDLTLTDTASDTSADTATYTTVTRLKVQVAAGVATGIGQQGFVPTGNQGNLRAPDLDLMVIPDTISVASPAAPDLEATPGVQSVTLTWDIVAGASYEYRIADGDWTDVPDSAIPATGTSASLTVPSTSTTAVMFSVRVKAAGYVPAGATAMVSATPDPVPLAPPAAPASIGATPGNGQVTLTWAAVDGATRYEYSTDGTAWAPIAAFTTNADGTLSTTVTGLTNGTPVSFQVRGVNSAGDGPPSAASAMVTPNPPLARPGKVMNLKAAPMDGQINLSWDTPTTGGAIVNYEYTRNSGVDWTDIPNSNAATTSYTVMNLTNGLTYSFIVRAENAAGTGQGSDSISATPMAPTLPAIPASISAAAGDGQVTLTWTAVEGATSYDYNKDNETAWTPILAADLTTNADGTLSTTVTGLPNGTEVTFKVRAVGAGGPGEGSVAAKAKPMKAATPPEAPTASVTVPAKSYVIIARTATPDGLPTSALPANPAGSATTISAWSTMPNLEDLFFRGGSLLLTTSKTKLDRDGKANTATEEAKERDVLITEIMAARNTAKVGTDRYLTHQWIELYNNLPVPVSVELSSKSGRPAPGAESDEIKLDLVSNVVNPGWDFTGLGADGTDDGLDDTADLQPFVSFYRKERGKNGHTKGHWATSTDTYVANHKGTPGAKERSGTVAVAPTNPTYKVVINEIGNYSDDKYDWIELRNVDHDGNLKKWQLWEITGDKSKSTILNFPDDDAYKNALGAAGDVLLIVATDPYQDPNHPLAAGINITKDNGRAETTGVKSRYYVAGTGFKLSNSGKTLLLLRSRNDGGDHEGIVDLTGTHFISDQSDAFATDLWPLKGQTKGNDNHGHGDVVKGADEDFRSGHVYKRINAGRGTGKEVWERAVYTGVGYKRSAAKDNQHGGTPGYDNGAVKVNEADLADSAMISISEIMYAKNRNEPQWIELYNSSTTQAINLNEWKLKIEHDRDVTDIDIRTTVTTNNLGGNIIIQPSQTVLIVSNTTGRTSRAAQGAVDFPATRIINLWAQKDKLEVSADKNRLTYRVLSNEAFKITLLDKSGTSVDVAGNLGATAAWDLPASENDEGRSSIIRRYVKGQGADDGTMADSWVFARDSHLTWVRFNETYYGSPDDIGTPGFRAGGPLPVSLSKFRPERLDDGSIRIAWVTESELNNAGFNILRSEERDGEFKQINTKLIAGQGTTSERTTYTHIDTSAKPNVVYYYQIQDVSLDGQVQTLRQSRLKGNVSAEGKLTTTWGELKALQ